MRHQISPVPKAGSDQVSPLGLRGGETQALRSGSGFCLHERGLWTSPGRADSERQERGREKEKSRCLVIVYLSVSVHEVR